MGDKDNTTRPGADHAAKPLAPAPVPMPAPSQVPHMTPKGLIPAPDALDR